MIRSSRRPGHALLELLLGMGISALLAALLLPAVSRVRETARTAVCRNNLRQVALAIHAHHGLTGHLPPYASGRDGEIHGGWFVHLLPFVEQDELYRRYCSLQESQHGSIRIKGPVMAVEGVRNASFPLLLCPSDPTRGSGGDSGRTNYLANWYAFSGGKGGVYAPAQRFEDLEDGLSHLVLLGEGYGHCNGLPRPALVSSYFHNFGVTQQAKPSDDPAYLPNDYTMFQVRPAECDRWRAQTAHPAMNIALADGSVRSVRPEIAPATWKALLKPCDGIPLGDW